MSNHRRRSDYRAHGLRGAAGSVHDEAGRSVLTHPRLDDDDELVGPQTPKQSPESSERPVL